MPRQRSACLPASLRTFTPGSKLLLPFTLELGDFIGNENP